MAFENDPEGYKMAVQYAGAMFDQPQIRLMEVLHEYDFSYSLKEFQELFGGAINSIPEEFRDSAIVELEDNRLRIAYMGREGDDAVAERIRRCEEYVASQRETERQTYEWLKKKFEPVP
jgi:hypothetical protein